MYWTHTPKEISYISQNPKSYIASKFWGTAKNNLTWKKTVSSTMWHLRFRKTLVCKVMAKCRSFPEGYERLHPCSTIIWKKAINLEQVIRHQSHGCPILNFHLMFFTHSSTKGRVSGRQNAERSLAMIIDTFMIGNEEGLSTDKSW